MPLDNVKLLRAYLLRSLLVQADGWWCINPEEVIHDGGPVVLMPINRDLPGVGIEEIDEMIRNLRGIYRE